MNKFTRPACVITCLPKPLIFDFGCIKENIWGESHHSFIVLEHLFDRWALHGPILLAFRSKTNYRAHRKALTTGLYGFSEGLNHHHWIQQKRCLRHRLRVHKAYPNPLRRGKWMGTPREAKTHSLYNGLLHHVV